MPETQSRKTFPILFKVKIFCDIFDRAKSYKQKGGDRLAKL